jgi:hypothetical protein
MKWILTFTMLISLTAVAGDYFYLPVDAVNVGPVSLEKANQVSSRLFLQHFNEVLAKTTKPLVIQLQWESPYFGGGALQDDSLVYVRIFGGMVRTPEMTEDIYALILCHEIGHMIGGEPYQDIPGAEWTSVEGQADFFAASVCLPRYFKTLEPSLSADLIQQRIELAGLGFLQLSQKYATSNQEPVSLEKTATEVATELNRHSYPSDQCRLDTFKAGASCLTEATCRAPACWLPR